MQSGSSPLRLLLTGQHVPHALGLLLRLKQAQQKLGAAGGMWIGDLGKVGAGRGAAGWVVLGRRCSGGQPGRGRSRCQRVARAALLHMLHRSIVAALSQAQSVEKRAHKEQAVFILRHPPSRVRSRGWAEHHALLVSQHHAAGLLPGTLGRWAALDLLHLPDETAVVVLRYRGREERKARQAGGRGGGGRWERVRALHLSPRAAQRRTMPYIAPLRPRKQR